MYNMLYCIIAIAACMKSEMNTLFRFILLFMIFCVYFNFWTRYGSKF